MLLLTLALFQNAEDLEKTAAADEKVYSLSHVIEKIQKKAATKTAEKHLGRKTTAAVRELLSALQAEMKKGTPLKQAAERASKSIDPSKMGRIRKSGDLKKTAAQQLRVLQWRYKYLRKARDIAKSRQKQRAIRITQELLWPKKKK